jgi:ketosteroid isomerase-like protein
MHPNEALIRKFYQAFSDKDGEAMARLYAPDVHFTDTIFDLRGARAAAMWKMFCKTGDLSIALLEAAGDDQGGSATWEAKYKFSATGRPVVNRIRARFTIQDGKIVRHVDEFSFSKWAAQAFGLIGRIAPGPLLRMMVRNAGTRAIDRFAAKR